MTLLVFDIGGTNLRVGIARAGRLSPKLTICPTPRSWAQALQSLRQSASELRSGTKIDLVVGGLPGVIASDRQRLLACPARPAWVDQRPAADLRRMFRCRVELQNDAVLGALGEATTGAGRGYRVVAYIAVGTGVGGARVVSQRVDAVAAGFEPGHHLVRGSRRWTTLVDGAHLHRRYGARWPRITPAAWRRVANDVAIGLVNTITFWSPDIIVLGGSVVLKGRLPLAYLRRQVAAKLQVVPRVPPIVKADLGDAAALVGAVAYAASLAQKR